MIFLLPFIMFLNLKIRFLFPLGLESKSLEWFIYTECRDYIQISYRKKNLYVFEYQT